MDGLDEPFFDVLPGAALLLDPDVIAAAVVPEARRIGSCRVSEGGDDLGELLFGDAAELADLDTAQLAGCLGFLTEDVL